MPRPFTTWTVLPHGKLKAIEPDILTVVGEIRMPLMTLPRRMTVIRVADARLIVWSAIALDPAEMASLEDFGRPAWLVVPSDKHRLDAKIWKARYPALQVVAPAGARAKVAEVVDVDTTAPDFGVPNVAFATVPGTRDREAALVVRTARGTTLVINDIIGNIGDAAGLGGWLLRLVGFAGTQPQIPHVVKMAIVKDTLALADQLREWAALDSLVRILVAHGAPIETDPRGVLRRLAESLG
jgi:hypothetical protein